MFKFIILFIVILCLFLYFTRDYVNPYKLIMIFGKKGSGKTTLLTKIAMKHIKMGWKVYSTVDLPFTIPFDPSIIGFYTFPENSVILIDEVGMIWDNRDFKTFKPEVRDFFKFQRQYKLKVYLFSQTFDIDLKLRNLTDEMYLLTNFMRVWSLCRRIQKRITISHADQNSSGVSQLVDDYHFIPIIFGGWSFTFIPRWKYYYNSYDPKPLSIYENDVLPATSEQKFYLSDSHYKFHAIKQFFLTLLYIPIFIVKKHKEKKSNSDFVKQLRQDDKGRPSD